MKKPKAEIKTDKYGITYLTYDEPKSGRKRRKRVTPSTFVIKMSDLRQEDDWGNRLHFEIHDKKNYRLSLRLATNEKYMSIFIKPYDKNTNL